MGNKPLEDGIYPVYVKDGTIYPLGLTAEQKEMFDFYMKVMPGTLTAINKPMGRAINVVDVLKAEKEVHGNDGGTTS